MNNYQIQRITSTQVKTQEANTKIFVPTERQTNKINIGVYSREEKPFQKNKIIAQILDESNADSKQYKAVQLILNTGKNELHQRKQFWTKKLSQLALLNLTEQEFLEKQEKLFIQQQEDLREIKMDILEKLELNNVRGFESFDKFMSSFDPQSQIRNKNQLFQDYLSFQFELIDSLSNMVYFQQDPSQIQQQNQADQKVQKTILNIDNLDQANQITEKQFQAFNSEGQFQGREQKKVSVKLSKYINFSQIQNHMKQRWIHQLREFFIEQQDLNKINKLIQGQKGQQEYDIDKIQKINQDLLEMYLELKNTHSINLETYKPKYLAVVAKATQIVLQQQNSNLNLPQQEVINIHDLLYLINKLIQNHTELN